MGFKLFTLATALALGSGSALAEPTDQQDVRAVIELFTSQGCSSCPPADAVLQKYAADPSVIALSLPVDYWDYLGWKDTFASPRNTDRQRLYAKSRGDGAVYTPQAVINGLVHANGAVKYDIENAISATGSLGLPKRVPIKFWPERNALNVEIGGAANPDQVKEATVWLGVVQSSGSVNIQRGENTGRSIVYTNIVKDLSPVGLWKGQPLKLEIPRSAVMTPETQKCVILVQEGRTGAIIGATLASLW